MVYDALADMRVDYGPGGFDVHVLASTWHEQLARWLAEAGAAGVAEANAMVLATADAAGRPASRTVLCKGLDARGVVFFTNYGSVKSGDLQATGRASATFPWYAQYRQVHVAGRVEVVSDPENQAYWASRPRGSQLGAWASTQSTVVADREGLDVALAEVTQRFAHVVEVPLPLHWGGWRIVPDRVEFWQGRSNRMHDRLRYERGPNDEWVIRRLAP